MASYSVAKSFTSAIVGLLVDDGLLDLDEHPPRPEWPAGDPRTAITLRQLLQMSSGLEWDEVQSLVTMGFVMLDSPSAAAIMASQPLEREPGSAFEYSTGTSALVAGIAADALGGCAALDDYVHERLLEPIGITTATITTDGGGCFVGGLGMDMTPRDFARFGLLWARGGMWDGEQVVSTSWVDETRVPAATNAQYGLHWWLGPTGQRGRRRRLRRSADRRVPRRRPRRGRQLDARQRRARRPRSSARSPPRSAWRPDVCRPDFGRTCDQDPDETSASRPDLSRRTSGGSSTGQLTRSRASSRSSTLIGPRWAVATAPSASTTTVTGRPAAPSSSASRPASSTYCSYVMPEAVEELPCVARLDAVDADEADVGAGRRRPPGTRGAPCDTVAHHVAHTLTTAGPRMAADVERGPAGVERRQLEVGQRRCPDASSPPPPHAASRSSAPAAVGTTRLTARCP